jgi:tetratricopeptide (TPR) repeat protein
MKCLEKNRGRRYESAAALAADIAHHRADVPISAGPPSQLYRLRKFARRNKGPVAATLGLLIVLCIGLVREARQRIESQRHAREAAEQAAIANAVGQFQADMLSSVDPGRLLGDKVTVLQVVTAAVKELDAGKLKDQPLVEASVRDTIGNTLRSLGRYDDAEPILRKALDLRRSFLPPGHTLIAESLFNLAIIVRNQGKLSETERLLRESLDICRKAVPVSERGIRATLMNLAELLRIEGRFAEAEALAREGVDVARRAYPAGHPDIAHSVHALAMVLHSAGRLPEAEPLYREAVQIDRGALPAGHPEIALKTGDLASVLMGQGKFAEAEPLYREALAIYRQTLPQDHPVLAMMINNLALLLEREDKVAEAEPLCRESLAICRRTLPPNNPDLAMAVNNMALLLQRQGKLADAEPLFRESLEILRKVPAPGHPDMAITLNNLGALMLEQGNPNEAEPLFREALAALGRSGTKEQWKFGIARVGLGRTLTALNRFAEAQTELIEAERALAMGEGASPGWHNRSIDALSKLYAAWDKAEAGKGYDAKAHQWQARLPTTRPTTPQATTQSSTWFGTMQAPISH